jgi:putative acetyltransferase
MRFCEATERDLVDVLQIHRHAFGQEDEALLVADLLQDPTAQPSLSLVAIEDDRKVGHVLYTALKLYGPVEDVACAILAPLAVEPAHQRHGIGRALIEHGCQILAERGVKLVFVLGDPDYYTRCNFVPAFPLGLKAPYPIEPEAAWMVRALHQGVLGTIRGTARCASSLAEEKYWRE